MPLMEGAGRDPEEVVAPQVGTIKVVDLEVGASLAFVRRAEGGIVVVVQDRTGKLIKQREQDVARCLERVEERRAEMREGDKEIARLRRETKRLITKMKAM